MGSHAGGITKQRLSTSQALVHSHLLCGFERVYFIQSACLKCRTIQRVPLYFMNSYIFVILFRSTGARDAVVEQLEC